MKYKARVKLKTTKISGLFLECPVSTRTESDHIYTYENLTNYRKYFVNEANKMRKDLLLQSACAWTQDGKIYVKTSPNGSPSRIYDENDLDNLLTVMLCIFLCP